tara:strand:+ start:4302 stop:4484 length:183 start_codon:yes stop_codon:yes gene_type:complete
MIGNSISHQDGQKAIIALEALFKAVIGNDLKRFNWLTFLSFSTVSEALLKDAFLITLNLV